MGTDTGKSQQLFGKSGPAFDLLFDAFKFFMQVMLPPKIMKQKRHISLDPHENIVKIVGDASGEGADGFHFLRLQQLRLQIGLYEQLAEVFKVEPFEFQLKRNSSNQL